MSPLCWDVSPAGELWVTAGVPKLVVHTTTHTHTSTRAHGYPHVSARACYLDTCTCIYMCVQIYAHRPSRRIHTCVVCVYLRTHMLSTCFCMHTRVIYLYLHTRAHMWGPDLTPMDLLHFLWPVSLKMFLGFIHTSDLNA